MCRDGALTRPSSAKNTLLSHSHRCTRCRAATAPCSRRLLITQINCQIRTLASQKSIAHLANPIAKTVMGPTVYVAPHSLSVWLNHHLLGSQLVLAPLQLGRRMQLGVVPYQALYKLHVGAFMHPRQCSPFLLAPLHLGRPLHLVPCLCSRRWAVARFRGRCVRGREGGIA